MIANWLNLTEITSPFENYKRLLNIRDTSTSASDLTVGRMRKRSQSIIETFDRGLETGIAVAASLNPSDQTQNWKHGLLFWSLGFISSPPRITSFILAQKNQKNDFTPMIGCIYISVKHRLLMQQNYFKVLFINFPLQTSKKKSRCCKNLLIFSKYFGKFWKETTWPPRDKPLRLRGVSRGGCGGGCRGNFFKILHTAWKFKPWGTATLDKVTSVE